MKGPFGKRLVAPLIVLALSSLPLAPVVDAASRGGGGGAARAGGGGGSAHAGGGGGARQNIQANNSTTIAVWSTNSAAAPGINPRDRSSW
jgi:hypothetical protein